MIHLISKYFEEDNVSFYYPTDYIEYAIWKKCNKSLQQISRKLNIVEDDPEALFEDNQQNTIVGLMRRLTIRSM